MASVDGVQRRLLALAGAAILLAMAVSPQRTIGLGLGAGTVSLSLWLYARVFDAAVRTGRRRLALGLTFVKLAAFLALGWGVLVWGAGVVDPVGFALGVTCLPLAALWEGLRTKGT